MPAEASKRGHALLRVALIGAAAVDLLFAAAVLVDWPGVLRLLGIDPPASPVFVELAALMVAGLATVFLVAGLRPVRLRGVIGVAAAVRAADAVLLSSFVVRRLLPAWVGVLAVGELVLAVLHFVYWRRLED